MFASNVLCYIACVVCSGLDCLRFVGDDVVYFRIMTLNSGIV